MPKSLYHIKYWPTWIGLFVLRLFVFLPIKLQYAIFRVVGILSFHLLKRRRHIAEVNIALCFPELSKEQQTQLVKDNMIATAWAVVEIANAFWASEDFYAKNSEIHGLELFHEAKKEGRGVLLLGMHFTSVELARRTVGHRFNDIDITYKTAKNAAFDYYLNRNRLGTFRSLVEKNEMRTLIKKLRAGSIMWFAPDQDFGREGSVFAPFFHEPAATIGNIGRILQMSGAKALFFHHHRAMRDGKPYYIAEIYDAFGDGFGDDPVANATLFNQVVADAIRKYPEQYLWVHERFRTRVDRNMPKRYGAAKKKKK